MKWWKWWNKERIPKSHFDNDKRLMADLLKPEPPVFTGMTHDLWTRSPEPAQRLAEAIRLNPVFSDAMSVLWSQVPRGYPARGIQITGETAAHELGRMNGWMSCIDMLESLTKWTPPKEPLQATYSETIEDQLAAQEVQ